MRLFRHLKNKELLVFLLFFILSFVLHLISSHFKFNIIIDGGDTDYPLSPLKEIAQSFMLWKHEALGTTDFFPLSRLFLSLVPLLNYFLFFLKSNILVFTFLWAMAGFSFYLLGRSLKLNIFPAICAGLFYVLNPYFYIRYHTPMIHITLSYMVLPLALYFLIQIIEKKINLKWGTIILSLLFLSISRTLNLWLLYIFLIPFFIFIFKYLGLIKFEIGVKHLVVVFLSVLSINLVILFMGIASASNYIGETQSSTLMSYYRDVQVSISSQYNLFESLGGWGTYAWLKNISDEKPGWQALDILRIVSKSQLVVLSCIPVLFAMFSNLRKKSWILVLVALGMLFFMNGYGWPFGNIYSVLLGSLPVYRDFFRDTWGYWGGIYIFAVSILFGLALNRYLTLKNNENLYIFNKVIVFITIAFWILLSTLLYVYPGKIIHNSWFVNIPSSYIEVAKILNSFEDIRVVPVPLTSQEFGYTETSWGYKGPDVLNRLTDATLIDKHLNAISNNSYISLVDGINPEDIALKSVLNETQASYVLLRKDFVSQDSQSQIDKYAKILSTGCFSKVLDSKELSLYKYNCLNTTSSKIRIADNILYGTKDCLKNSLFTNVSFEDSPLCITLKDVSPKLSGDYLLFDFESKPIEGVIVSPPELADAEMILNGNSVLENSVELKKDNKLLINFRTFGSELIPHDFISSVPSTCDAAESVDNVSFTNLGSSLQIISANKKVCIYRKVNNLTEYKNKSGIINISSKGVSLDDAQFMIFSEKLKKELLRINLSESASNSTYSVDKRKSSSSVVYNIFIKDLSFIDSESYVYLLLNQNRSYIQGEITDFRFIYFDSSISDLKFESKNLEKKGQNIKSLDYKEIIKNNLYIMETKASENLNILNLNTNFNNSWKLFGIKSNRIEAINDDKHILVDDWSNGWVLNNQEYDYLILIYLPELIYLGGILISVITLITLLLFV